MIVKLIKPIGVLKRIWALGKMWHYVNINKITKLGAFGMVKKMVEPIGALQVRWEFSRR